MSAPIGHTCPDIDKVIKRLQPLIKQIGNLKSYDYEDAKLVEGLLDECVWEMDNAIDVFEELRKSNDILRTWGTEMEEEAESLSVQYSELEEKYNNQHSIITA